MSRADAAPWPLPGAVFRASVVTTLVLALGAATVVAAIVADGSIPAVVAPIAGVAMLCAIWFAPVRIPLFALTFLALVLDKPGDSSGLWQSPLAPLGGLLIHNLNKTINVDALKFSVLTLLILYLLFIRFFRAVSSSSPDEAGSLMPSRALLGAIGLSFSAALGLTLYGVATGGDVQMSKLQLLDFLMLLAVSYLMAVSLRGTKDYRTLATIVVAAACVKSIVAVWVRMQLPRFIGTYEVEYATTHGDSLLLACAVVLLVSAYFEKPIRRNFVRGLLIMPILLAGLVANDRRLAWVQIGLSFMIMIALDPRRRPARAIIRIGLHAIPVILLYIAIGWNSSNAVFGPVQMIRSMQDDTVDRSTMFRDIENYNLVATSNRHPLGTGFGHPFEEAVRNDALPGFKEYPYLPHNSVLGLWAFCGPIGFSALWSVFLVGMFLAVRSYRVARLPEYRVAATMAITSIVVYIVHCWGDIGFTEYKAIFLVGPGLAIAGQIAVATGAWPGAARGARKTIEV